MLPYYSQTVSAIATATCDLRATALLLFEAITQEKALYSPGTKKSYKKQNQHYNQNSRKDPKLKTECIV